MDHPPNRDERLLEALEACRPGSADLSDPALAHLAAEIAVDPALERLYERLQRVDARLAAAFQDAPVPAGLAERIGQRLAVAQREGRRAEAAESEPVTVAPGPRRVSRRWLLVAAGTLTSAACLLIAVWLGNRPKPYSRDAALEDALAYFVRDQEQPWGDRFEGDCEDFPFSRDLIPRAGGKWRTIQGFLGQSGVAYDLASPTGARATLYVVDCDVQDLDNLPPLAPGANTGNLWAAAWQDRGHVYVLVVQGRRADYGNFLKPSAGAV